MGVIELAIILACCATPFILIALGGLIFAIARWGVITRYWLKGEEPVRDGGDYTLDQSRDAADTENDHRL